MLKVRKSLWFNLLLCVIGNLCNAIEFVVRRVNNFGYFLVELGSLIFLALGVMYLHNPNEVIEGFNEFRKINGNISYINILTLILILYLFFLIIKKISSITKDEYFYLPGGVISIRKDEEGYKPYYYKFKNLYTDNIFEITLNYNGFVTKGYTKYIVSENDKAKYVGDIFNIDKIKIYGEDNRVIEEIPFNYIKEIRSKSISGGKAREIIKGN